MNLFEEKRIRLVNVSHVIKMIEIISINRLLLLLLLIGVRCARPGESENTLSVQRPHPTQPTHGRKTNIKQYRRLKRKSRSCQQESIISALETRQSHKIKHRVTKIV